MGGVAGSAALAALTRPANAAIAFSSAGASSNNILVAMFLHGAMDSLNFLAPADDPNYIAARPDTLRVVNSGATPGIALSNGPTKQDWRLHPNAAPLKPIYDAGQLAFVHAAGLQANTRSHFQATDLMERGITDPSQINSAEGWLTKHMRGVTAPLAAVATTTIAPERLTGDTNAVGMTTTSSFRLYQSGLQSFLKSAYSGAAPLAAQGMATLGALDSLRSDEAGQASVSTQGDSTLEIAFDTIVNLIKWNVGLEVATVEYGSWDTHHSQAQIFPKMAGDVSNALAKFYNDLSSLNANVTLIAMTEFGRRVQSNASGGTDHGHGSAMIAMGAGVAGGQIYGQWPGLESSALDLGDLAVTTDYRNVVAEALVNRRGESDVGAVFPTLAQYSPLGIFQKAGV
jgi:uncharacterized protein (DUF1501 family)